MFSSTHLASLQVDDLTHAVKKEKKSATRTPKQNGTTKQHDIRGSDFFSDFEYKRVVVVGNNEKRYYKVVLTLSIREWGMEGYLSFKEWFEHEDKKKS